MLTSPRAVRVPDGATSFDDAAMRATGALGLGGIALIHFLDLFGKLEETPYLGVAYLALIAACVLLGGVLLRGPSRSAWVLASGVAAVAFLAYVVSRSVGLPSATDDIGNWTEPLGLAALFTEGAVVLLGAYAAILCQGGQSRRRVRS